ncbi:hypothetical protein HHO41_01430 [Bacillus sp. DNRA2]|uniref:LAGLIDADG family homing endonuclease n=1 Tax=Bacillus sp. DNRA2 TaxID=2723053 RepID=UPI00145F8E31|nr:LAGLIDADG family homing endonuclease [Bacillus sp. DNRA2]NMD68930.1 hypothetical protein [Bacillus sp. DNRA2]
MEPWEAAYVAGIIDGEGSITLTRMHQKEFRRPNITIASTDLELLIYIQGLTGGNINNKKNYNPEKHKRSYTLNIKKKIEILYTLEKITPYLRINKKRNRANWILNQYDAVTIRNGKYTEIQREKKLTFEKEFFML